MTTPTSISLEIIGGGGGETELADAISSSLDLIGAKLISVNGKNMCEGCSHCRYPGVRWPASPDSNSDRSWVERCDYCERHENDLDAAIRIAMDMGCGIGIAYCSLWDDGHPDASFEEPYLEPRRYGRVKLTEIWAESPPGTAIFVDRPERDVMEVST